MNIIQSVFKRPKLAVLAASCVTVVAIASMYAYVNNRPKPPGNELELEGGAYGWHASKDVGVVFTDGLNIANISSQAGGPLRLISARPLMDGPTLRVRGVLVRVVPDMLPPDHQVGGFQESPGFPPTMHDAGGGVEVEDLVIYPSESDQKRWIELQIGYEVVAEGRSTRRGVELTYEYQGEIHKAIIPSYLAICAPSTAECEPEYDE